MVASLFTLVVLAVAKWLVRETQDRAVLVRALVRNIALCSQNSHRVSPLFGGVTPIFGLAPNPGGNIVILWSLNAT